MKKSILIIISALGLGYIGISWHTGNIIEREFDNNLQSLTEKINSYQQLFDITISKSHYQKNIFSTKVHLTFTLSPKNQSQKNTLKIFDDDLTIYHGPFPTAALANGVFTPKFAWIEYEMSKITSPELWKMAGNKSFITGHASIGYGQSLIVKLATKAIKLNHSKLELYISDVIYNLESGEDRNQLISTLKFDNLTFYKNKQDSISFEQFILTAKPNQDQIEYKMNLGNLHINVGTINRFLFDISNIENKGHYALNIDEQGIFTIPNIDSITNIDKIKFTSTYVPPIGINNLNIKLSSKLNDNLTVDGSFITNINSITYGNQNLGSGKLDINYEGIDSEDLGYPVDPITKEKWLINNFLTSSNRKISLNNLSWHNDEGDIVIRALIEITDDIYKYRNIDKTKALKWDMDIPIKVLGRIKAQADNPRDNNVQLEEIQSSSRELFIICNQFLRDNPLFKFDKNNEKGIYSNIDYNLERDKDEVDVNDKKLNKQDFFNQLIRTMQLLIAK